MINNMEKNIHNTIDIEITLMKIKFYRATLFILAVSVFSKIESVAFSHIFISLIFQ